MQLTTQLLPQTKA